MKQHLNTVILAVCALALAVFAAVNAAVAQTSTPAPTEALVRIQSEVTNGDVTAFFEKSVEVNGTKFRLPWESVSWNASDKVVTVGGQSLTYAEVMGYVVAIAMQERAAQLAAPPPQPPAPLPAPAPAPAPSKE